MYEPDLLSKNAITWIKETSYYHLHKSGISKCQMDDELNEFKSNGFHDVFITLCLKNESPFAMQSNSSNLEDLGCLIQLCHPCR